MHNDPGSREAIALDEVGHTDVSRGVALGLLVVLVTLMVMSTLVELVQPATHWSNRTKPWVRLTSLVSQIPSAVQTAFTEGLVAGNRQLHGVIEAFENGLEEDSALIALVQPQTQLLLTRWLRAGNEEVYPGRDGWLYFRPDVDFLTGAPFLAPEVLKLRARGGDQWSPPPQPDPLPAIAELRRQVEAAGAELLVIPTPLKPAIHPEMFSRRYADATGPIRNPSEEDFATRLQELGTAVFDPAVVMARARQESGQTQFLRTDTHWTPEAVDQVARQLAALIHTRYGLQPVIRFDRRDAIAENLGDLAVKLRLPPGQSLVTPETVLIQRVFGLDRQLWKPDPGADILLLGDSFTNVFSAPELGWGTAAGLAEQLSFHLGRPLDRLAVNAGGAHATREALRRAVGGEQGRLAGKRLVLYQFANRELAGGNWKLFD
ncbi:MAG: hypothetical protein V3S30_01645 [Thermoanaerobaculia bacterium]